MGLNYSQWKARIADRSDMTGMLSHLTKPASDIDSLDNSRIHEYATINLIKILTEQVICGSTTEKGFIVGGTPPACFQDVPLYGLVQNIDHEQERRCYNPSERLRYCGVGLAFSKWYVFARGGRPVFYERTSDAKQLLPES